MIRVGKKTLTLRTKFFGEDGLDTDLPTELELKLLNSTPGKLFFLFVPLFSLSF